MKITGAFNLDDIARLRGQLGLSEIHMSARGTRRLAAVTHPVYGTQVYVADHEADALDGAVAKLTAVMGAQLA